MALAAAALLSCAPRHPLEGTNVYKRREAALMLGEDPLLALEAVPALLKALRDDDAQVRWRAEFALGRTGAEGVPKLIDALRGPDRWAAAYVLGPLGRHARPALPALLEAARDPDPFVRVWAVNAIREIDPASPALAAAAKDDHPDVRRVASVVRIPPAAETVRLPDVPLALVVHWGLFSVPHRARPGERAERLQENEKLSAGEVEILGAGFTASRFDPDDWVRLAKETGAGAIIVTAKGRDGFCLWDTKHSEFNAVTASEAKRDLLQGLSTACAKSGLKFGVSYSIVDGHHRDYSLDSPLYVDWMQRQVEELVTRFPVWGIWFDSEGGPSPRAWRAEDLAARVRRIRPQAIVNQTPARRSFGLSRGYAETLDPLWSGERMIEEFVETVSAGGSLFIDIGARATGTIPEEIQERLALFGGWHWRNREAVRGADPSPFGGPIPAGPVTARGNRLYVFLATRPAGPIAFPRLKNRILKASLLDGGAALTVTAGGVTPPGELHDSPYTVVAVELDGPPRVE